MKNITLLSIVLLLLVASCGKEEEKIDYIVLSGKIEHPNSDSLFITTNTGDHIHSIALNKDNTFRDTFVVKESYYMLDDGRDQTSVYLKSGYNLNIILDAEKFDESLSYEGVGASENNYFAKKTLKTEGIRKILVSHFESEPNEKSFLKFTDSVNTVYTDLLNTTPDIDNSFKSIEKKNIFLEYISNLATYQDVLTNYGEEPQNLSKNFPNPLENFDINNDTLASFYLYTFMAEKVLAPIAQKELQKDTTKSDITISYLRAVASVLKSDKGRDEIVYNYFKVYIRETKDFETFFNLSDSLIKNPEYKKLIQQKKEALDKIAAGKPSPAFELYDINNQLVTLNSLKGKLVYIDIWATWCGPCKQELQPLKELEEKFNKKNVAFVSICVWDEKEKWMKMVKDKKMGGIQLFAPDKNMIFLKDYMIEGIPHFILLDKEGNIINANANRPSDGGMEEELNSLLK